MESISLGEWEFCCWLLHWGKGCRLISTIYWEQRIQMWWQKDRKSLCSPRRSKKKINLKKTQTKLQQQKNPTTSPSKSTNLISHPLENKRNFSDLTILVGLSQPRKFCNSRTWDLHFRLSLKPLSPEASSTELIPFFIGILQQIHGFILKKFLVWIQGMQMEGTNDRILSSMKGFQSSRIKGKSCC